MRTFRAETPRPLPGRGRVLLLRFRGPVLAGAAVAVIALALARLHLPTDHTSVVKGPAPAASTIDDEVSLSRLSALANQDQAELDSHLDQISPNLLPDVQKGRGVLRVLSGQ